MMSAAIGLLVLAVFCGYLASRRAEKWGYWSNYWSALAVLGLAWLAWPNRVERSHGPQLTESERAMFVAVQNSYLRNRNHEHNSD